MILIFPLNVWVTKKLELVARRVEYFMLFDHAIKKLCFFRHFNVPDTLALKKSSPRKTSTCALK